MEQEHPAFLNITAENIAHTHLSCIIRKQKPHPGIEGKRAWLAERIKEGHVFRKLDADETVMIEYAPLETAWTPIVGDNFIYIYCLWVLGACKGKGYGTALMEYCLADAKAQGKSGVCMLGAEKQKAWLSDQSFAKKFGFTCVDKTEYGYELLALSFDGTVPHFTDAAKAGRIDSKVLTIYYDAQCPFVLRSVEMAKTFCAAHQAPLSLIPVTALYQAKALPCGFNNFAVFYQGRLETVNPLSEANLKRILEKDE